jgi:hypothetical protein
MHHLGDLATPRATCTTSFTDATCVIKECFFGVRRNAHSVEGKRVPAARARAVLKKAQPAQSRPPLRPRQPPRPRGRRLPAALTDLCAKPGVWPEQIAPSLDGGANFGASRSRCRSRKSSPPCQRTAVARKRHPLPPVAAALKAPESQLGCCVAAQRAMRSKDHRWPGRPLGRLQQRQPPALLYWPLAQRRLCVPRKSLALAPRAERGGFFSAVAAGTGPASAEPALWAARLSWAISCAGGGAMAVAVQGAMATTTAAGFW